MEDSSTLGGDLFRYLKAFGLLLIGLGLLVLHRYVAKLAGTNTAAPLSHTRDLLRTKTAAAGGSAAGGARPQLRKRRGPSA
jgi:hypothetical protein